MVLPIVKTKNIKKSMLFNLYLTPVISREWKDLGKPKPDNKGRQRGFAYPDLLEWLIPWPIIPSELGCGELDCNRNGIPDYEENPCK